MEDRGRKTGSGGKREKDRKWRIEGERQEVGDKGRKRGSGGKREKDRKWRIEGDMVFVARESPLAA